MTMRYDVTITCIYRGDTGTSIVLILPLSRGEYCDNYQQEAKQCLRRLKSR
jgi:hypothetical protein